MSVLKNNKLFEPLPVPDCMISVIGAGPAGSYTAYKLAKKGHEVSMFEEHVRIGEPVACTGICTNDLMNLVPPKKDILLTKLKRVRVFAPDNNQATIEMKKPDVVFDRGAYDRQVAAMAHDAGVIINTQHRFMKREGDAITVKSHKEGKLKQLKTRYLIGADGPSSTVAKDANMFGRKKHWVGIQATVKGEFDPETFDTYLGSVAPTFFGWVVPEDEKHARAGLAAPVNAHNYFSAFMKRIKVTETNVCSKLGGIIPQYNPKIKAQKGTTYLVGDAATQVKATTGGGIIQSLLAAEAVAESIEKGTSYDKLWRNAVGRDLWIALKVRQVLNKFSDAQYNKLIESVKHPKVQEVLATHSRDRAASLMPKLLLANPRLARFATVLVKP